MGRLTQLQVLGALLIVTGLSAPSARAQGAPDSDEARAKELYQNGAILFEEGRYSDAIIAWKEAYRLSQRPQLLFNIANAAERGGQLQEAYDALVLYRSSAPEDERDSLDRRIRAVQQRMEESGTPATPPPPPPIVQTQTDPDVSKGRSLALPLALYGVGAAGLGVGTVSGLRALAARRDADLLCVDAGLCPDEAEPLLRADRNASLLADIGFGVGAAGVVGGTLSLLLGGGHSTAVGISPSFGAGGGWSMRWTGSF